MQLDVKDLLRQKKLKTIYLKSRNRGPGVNVTKKKFLEVLEAAPELRRDKLAVLKKAITEGTYQVKADYIAERILTELLLELSLNANDHEGRRYTND